MIFEKSEATVNLILLYKFLLLYFSGKIDLKIKAVNLQSEMTG